MLSESMASSSAEKQNASDIANKYIYKYSNLKNFLDILLMNIDVEQNQVGQSFQYPLSVIKKKLFPCYGILMDLFIRKLLANKYKIETKDEYAEIILKDVDKYFTNNVKAIILPKDIKENYEIFKNPSTKALDILQSIQKVSLSTTIYFKDELPRIEVDYYKENLLEIKTYFEKLAFSRAEIKSDVDCLYFEGNADIVFDQKVLYEIKTSQYEFLKHNARKFELKNFHKLILYGFGYFKRTGVIIKKYTIYNPLLGQTFTIEFQDIDMILFENVLKKDLKALGRDR